MRNLARGFGVVACVGLLAACTALVGVEDVSGEMDGGVVRDAAADGGRDRLDGGPDRSADGARDATKPNDGSTHDGSMRDGSGHADATQQCGNGTCDPGESCATCPADCPGDCDAGSGSDGAALPECNIEGSAHASGAANPSNSCQVCDPGTSLTTWSGATEGTPCGTGGICHLATCGSGCVIGGVYYTAGANPTNECQSCQPATSTSKWTDTDGISCGAGGTCCSGACANEATGRCVYTLASGFSSNSTIIAVDATSVYWTGVGTLLKVPIGGGSVTTLLSGLDAPHVFAANSTSLYFATGSGTVMKIPLGGGTATTVASAAPGGGLGTLDSTNVYWTTAGAGMTLNKAPLQGGAVTTLASGQGPGGLAVDSTTVYWADAPGNSVLKVPIDGGTVTTLTSDASSPVGLAIDATRIYYANEFGALYDGGPVSGAGGNIAWIPKSGGSPTTLAAGQNEASFVAVSGTSVYWTTDGVGVAPTGTVMRVPLAGGALTTLASGLSTVGNIVVDDTSVYWLNFIGGDAGAVVMKTPK